MIDEVFDWMHSKGLPLGMLVRRLSDTYTESQILYAAQKVYETEPEIKNIHLYWKIKYIMDTRPHSEYRRRIARLQKAFRLMDVIPWYAKVFGETNGIGVW